MSSPDSVGSTISVTSPVERKRMVSGRGSGDLFLAFSTANAGAAASRGEHSVQALPNGQISPLFEATVHAVEEAIVNAMVAAETMTGADGRTVQALPHAAVQELLRKYGRLGK